MTVKRRALERDPRDLWRVDGADALDLLHRIAASDVRGIEPGQHRLLVLTDDKGRVIDTPTLFHRGDHLALIATPTRGEALREWIEKWVIIEDVTLTPLDESVVEVLPVAVGTTSTFEFGGSAGEDAIDLDLWRTWHVGNAIAAGPALAAGPNPLEIGLHHRIGWTKGCYIGQEVVARLDTYEKVKRRLAVLVFAEDVAMPDDAPAVRVDGKKVGMVLDAIGRCALAVVDKSIDGGSKVEVEELGVAEVKVPPEGRAI